MNVYMYIIYIYILIYKVHIYPYSVSKYTFMHTLCIMHILWVRSHLIPGMHLQATLSSLDDREKLLWRQKQGKFFASCGSGEVAKKRSLW